jgi:hypothetical protein
MNRQSLKRNCLRVVLLLVLGVALGAAVSVHAAGWSGIEPYKSKRVDVERILGSPERDQMDVDGSLHFRVVGGTAIISFVDAKFAAAKQLAANKVGTVKEITLQHDGGSDTPESLKLVGNGAYLHEENNGVVVYRNLKEGIAFTFIGGKLRTTYYFPGGAQTKTSLGIL